MKWMLYKKCLAAGLLVGMLLPAAGAHAQLSHEYLRAANSYFAKADYSSASAYYEKYLKAGSNKGHAGSDPYALTAAEMKQKTAVSSRLQALYQLAESYRLLTDYDKAAPLYQQVVALDSVQLPLATFHYALVLRAQGKYNEAEQQLGRFLHSYSAQDVDREAATREIQNVQYIKTQLARKDAHLFTITKLAEGKEGASYAPVKLGDTALLFTATWSQGRKWGKAHTNYLCQASYQNGVLGDAVKAALPASDMQEGAAALSEDGSTLYFTRWAVLSGKKSAAIYVSRQAVKGVWDKPVVLGEVVNTPGYNMQQPCLLPGGKGLLYVSDKAGGFGGYDLWYAQLDVNGKPISSVNLGNTINTAYNEQAPYYHAASGTLVFATDGRTGLGGYDLFYSKGQPGSWSVPENFGYPVNSLKDDMYFISASASGQLLDQAVISSDRTAACCLELMTVHQQIVPVVAKADTVVVPQVTVVKETPVIAPVDLTGKIVGTVRYAYSEAVVTPSSYIALDSIVHLLQTDTAMQVEVGGHTDDRGTEAFNLALSESRAASVVAYLVSKGIDKNRLVIKGYGATVPLAPNKKEDGSDNPEGRERNRRTEIKILKRSS
ncbi:Outer membrane protein OmpA [Filimonas lacunae]|uniref:Outer membrane protein OmpA n=1 Tax=Filimonas lacunae TaxID=477680 RepID=A0A173M987_9BACT|nr:OmpA family protein [Filimonas lacunae]BAV04038.1 outer membrane lipoprotein omp16 precursor [Filimonas lacunae]SIT16186.1 Outer membrane protein OmpA [Filimonas lacunae]